LAVDDRHVHYCVNTKNQAWRDPTPVRHVFFFDEELRNSERFTG
jgi:hypothetical protein